MMVKLRKASRQGRSYGGHGESLLCSIQYSMDLDYVLSIIGTFNDRVCVVARQYHATHHFCEPHLVLCHSCLQPSAAWPP